MTTYPIEISAERLDTHQTARERAYQALRYRLVTLDLPPGAVIDVQQLAIETGVGKTPLVEAIQRLALENLLAIHPRRGTVVTEPTVSQARHVFEIRDVFEARAARLAAERVQRTELDEMRKLQDIQAAERNEMEYGAFLLNDFRLHMIVAQASGNPMLVRALDHLLALNLRLWFVFFQVHGPQINYLFSHEPILRAIQARRPDEAKAAAIAHVRESNDALLSLFRPMQASAVE